MYLLTDTPDIMLHDERVLVRRRSPSLGSNTVVVDGIRLHRGFDAEFALYCNIQPVSGREKMDLDEGQRFDEQYWCYIDDSQNPTQADDLIYRPDDGFWYVVADSENWGAYTKLRIRQLDVGAPVDESGDPLADYDRQLFVSTGQIR